MLLADTGMAAAAVLAAVLAWAGAAKLARHRTTADGFRAMRIPLAEPASGAVPATELVAAVALLALPAIGAVLALALLVAFTALLVVRVREGVAVPCACFGQPHAPPLSWLEVLRNVMLVGLGGLALFAGEARVPGLRGVLVAGGLTLLGVAALHHLRHTRDRAGATSP